MRALAFHVLLVATSCLVIGMPVRAEIYKFVDDNGFVTYTNMPRPGVKAQVVIPDTLSGSTSKGLTSTSPPKSTRSNKQISTPGYFPRVDTGTQRKRDDMRRQLLEEEMSGERRNLAAAQAAFSAGSRRPGADLKSLMDSVRLHEKNIEMLTKELSRIR